MKRHVLLRGLFGALAVVVATSVAAGPDAIGPGAERPPETAAFELRPRPVVLSGPALSGAALPIELVLDDGVAEGDVGFNGATARQFLWFNAFAGTAEPLDLEEIRVLFGPGPQMTVGAPVELVVFHDVDSDPTNGAELLATVDGTIQVLDGTTFSTYPLAPAVAAPAGGSLYLGVVDRFVQSGVTPPVFPAAVDTTTDLGASWLAAWIGDPPDPPSLPPDNLLTSTSGTWMIRGFGTLAPIPAVEVPTVGAWGLASLFALLGLAGLVMAGHRHGVDGSEGAG